MSVNISSLKMARAYFPEQIKPGKPLLANLETMEFFYNLFTVGYDINCNVTGCYQIDENRYEFRTDTPFYGSAGCNIQVGDITTRVKSTFTHIYECDKEIPNGKIHICGLGFTGVSFTENTITLKDKNGWEFTLEFNARSSADETPSWTENYLVRVVSGDNKWTLLPQWNNAGLSTTKEYLNALHAQVFRSFVSDGQTLFYLAKNTQNNPLSTNYRLGTEYGYEVFCNTPEIKAITNFTNYSQYACSNSAGLVNGWNDRWTMNTVTGAIVNKIVSGINNPTPTYYTNNTYNKICLNFGIEGVSVWTLPGLYAPTKSSPLGTDRYMEIQGREIWIGDAYYTFTTRAFDLSDKEWSYYSLDSRSFEFCPKYIADWDLISYSNASTLNSFTTFGIDCVIYKPQNTSTTITFNTDSIGSNYYKIDLIIRPLQELTSPITFAGKTFTVNKVNEFVTLTLLTNKTNPTFIIPQVLEQGVEIHSIRFYNKQYKFENTIFPDDIVIVDEDEPLMINSMGDISIPDITDHRQNTFYDFYGNITEEGQPLNKPSIIECRPPNYDFDYVFGATNSYWIQSKWHATRIMAIYPHTDYNTIIKENATYYKENN